MVDPYVYDNPPEGTGIVVPVGTVVPGTDCGVTIQSGTAAFGADAKPLPQT